MSMLKKDDQSVILQVSEPPDDLQLEQDASVGVKTVEAAEKVYGKHSKWFLFIGSVLYLPRLDTRLRFSSSLTSNNTG